jgi:hypothetical protein
MGFVVIRLSPFKFGNELIEAITLTKHVADLSDLYGADGMAVELLECGTRFLVTEPSLSLFLKTNFHQSFAGLGEGGAGNLSGVIKRT